jgi:hypothetical protein
MGGDKPLGLLLGALVVAALVFLPALTVVLYYVVASVSALVVGPDFDSGTSETPALLVGLVGTVAVEVLLVSALVALLGRRLSPRRRDA